MFPIAFCLLALQIWTSAAEDPTWSDWRPMTWTLQAKDASSQECQDAMVGCAFVQQDCLRGNNPDSAEWILPLLRPANKRRKRSTVAEQKKWTELMQKLGLSKYTEAEPQSIASIASISFEEQQKAAYAACWEFREICMEIMDYCKISPDCFNEHRCCEPWSNKGQCLGNPDYMLQNCKPACAQCIPHYKFWPENDTEECVNFDRRCATWQSIGECEANPDWMNNNCRASCGSCAMFTEASLAKRCTVGDPSTRGLP